MADPVGFTRHDHSRCIRSALANAEAQCAARQLRLTPVRRRVLEILLESHEALGAYDILARLGEDGSAPKPPIAYRALSFLTEQGLAHRIERRNAFVACTRPGETHDPAFFICRSCERVAEVAAPEDHLAEGGFRIECRVIEAEGLCPSCQNGAAA